MEAWDAIRHEYEQRKLQTRGCAEKRRHTSRRMALGALRVTLKRRPDPGDDFQMTAYKCKVCGGWHIGHNRRKRES